MENMKKIDFYYSIDMHELVIIDSYSYILNLEPFEIELIKVKF